MRILIIHQNFPGQFRALARNLASDPDVSLVVIGKQGCPGLPGARLLTYAIERAPAASTHRYARPFESGIVYGQAVARLLQQLAGEGFVPDVVLGHPGWGETLFVKDVFPRARLVHFCEFYYHARGADAGFDPEFPMSLDDAARIRTRNALLLMSLEHCDAAVAPTAWQKHLHPQAYQDKIAVLHEGIDTEFMQADPLASFTLPTGKVLRAGDPVVTYVARNLEPYRGFHSFMRALPQLLARHPDCEVVIVGGDDVSYGGKPGNAANWREKMLAELNLRSNRVHFLGKVPYNAYRSLLQVSAAHVYLTYPFVLSWSVLEAMACGCALVASDTAPVREVVRDGENGWLVNFFDAKAIVDRVGAVLSVADGSADMRQRAARSVREKFSIGAGVAGYRRLLGLDAAYRSDRQINILEKAENGDS